MCNCNRCNSGFGCGSNSSCCYKIVNTLSVSPVYGFLGGCGGSFVQSTQNNGFNNCGCMANNSYNNCGCPMISSNFNNNCHCQRNNFC